MSFLDGICVLCLGFFTASLGVTSPLKLGQKGWFESSTSEIYENLWMHTCFAWMCPAGHRAVSCTKIRVASSRSNCRTLPNCDPVKSSIVQRPALSRTSLQLVKASNHTSDSYTLIMLKICKTMMSSWGHNILASKKKMIACYLKKENDCLLLEKQCGRPWRNSFQPVCVDFLVMKWPGFILAMRIALI